MKSFKISSRLLAEDLFGGGFKPPTTAYNPEEVTNENVLTTLVTFLSNLMGFITTLGGLFFIVYFVIGAFQWISAGSDSGKVEKAQTRIKNAILGLIVMILSYSLIGMIGQLIGLDLINLQDTIELIVAPITS